MNDPIVLAYRILKRPLLTEKGSAELERRNAYVFEVPLDAGKIEIGKAVEAIYGVKVLAVQTMRRHGKMRRRGRFIGRASDWKKAIVRLKAGERLEIY